MAVHPCWKCTAACCLKIMDLHDQVRIKQIRWSSFMFVNLAAVPNSDLSTPQRMVNSKIRFVIMIYCDTIPENSNHRHHQQFIIARTIQVIAWPVGSSPRLRVVAHRCQAAPYLRWKKGWNDEDPGDICGKKRAMSATRKNWQLWLIGFLLKGIAFRSQLLNLHRVLVPFQWARH